MASRISPCPIINGIRIGSERVQPITVGYLTQCLFILYISDLQSILILFQQLFSNDLRKFFHKYLLSLDCEYAMINWRKESTNE